MRKKITNSARSHSHIFLKTILMLIFCFNQIKTSWAQTSFQKGFGTTFHNKLVSAHQTSDGNIIAAGNTFPGNHARVCLVKTNMSGDTLWTRTYGGTANFYCNTIEQTLDNGFILGGKVVDTLSNNFKIFLIKTDSNGSIVWSKTYDRVDSLRHDEVHAIKQTQNSDYFIAGYGFVAKINSIGNIIWEKYLNDDIVNFGVAVDVYIHSLDITYDGGIILGGSIDTTEVTPLAIIQKPSYAYLQKMSASGNIMWTKAYKSVHNKYDQGFSVAETLDKGFILTGITYVPVGFNGVINHIYLVKADSLGNLTWTKKYASSANDNGADVKQTADGGYIIAGSSTGFNGNGLYGSNAFLLKTSANGNIFWCKYYGFSANAGDGANSVNIASDGSYIVSGITTGANGFPDNLFLLKTDVSGNVNCSGFNWPLYDSTYISTGISLNQTIITSSLIVGSPSINAKHLICNNYEPCPLSLTESEKELLVKIYPNPNNGLFKVKIENEIKNGKLILINSLGQKVCEQNINQGTNDVITNGLAKGLYSCILLHDSGPVNAVRLLIE